METFSTLLAICVGNSPVTSEFHAQRPVTRSFDSFFGLRLNKWLSKWLWGWWFETHRAHYDVIVMWVFIMAESWEVKIYVNQFWQWSQVGWMLAHHTDGLLSSSFSLILDSSVGLWVGIQSAGDLVSQTSKVWILHSAEEDNLSPFDSKSLPKIKSKSNNTYIG